MGRYRLILEYDGGPYTGWQSQPDGRGVQDAVERAIARVDGGARRTAVAGRTDAGVHATGQVAHVDLVKPWTGWKLREALNAWLREDGPVSVLAADAAGDDFDARFSALGRTYLYRIAPRRAPLTLEKGRAWRVPFALDLDAMREAARRLTGHHDFTTFRDAECQAKSPMRTLDRFEIREATGPAGDELHGVLEARSFLHRQVRSMMGTLVDVGRGRWTPDDVTAALEARDRARCGEVAPPWGLYLTGVRY